MSKFTYRVQDEKAEIIEGILEAASEAQAQKLLADHHYEILSLTPLQGHPSIQEFLDRFEQPNHVQFNFFVRQMATMLKAGVPMMSTLLTLEDGLKDPMLKRVIGAIHLDVEKGTSFSQAVARHPRVFNRLFCSTVRGGEAIGELDTVLTRLAAILEKDYQTTQKIKSALSYPIIATFVMVSAFLTATLFIIPRFKSLFSSFGAELPLPTKILMGLSEVVIQYWYMVLIAIIGMAIGIYYHFKTHQGRRFWEGGLLKIPVFGTLVQNAIFSRFSRMLGLMLKSGVNLLQALELIADIVGNSVIADAILRIKDRVEQGDSVAEPMRQEGIFPLLLIQLIHVGEESGKMDELLLQVAEFYDSELELMVKNLESLIEPFFIIFLGVFVAIMALGIFLPMWNIFAVIQQAAA